MVIQLSFQSGKLEVDYQLIIKNIIPKIANPSQIATILKFFELIFPFLYSSWHYYINFPDSTVMPAALCKQSLTTYLGYTIKIDEHDVSS